MPLTISCAFNTSLESHEHTVIAEQLGYKRAFFFDSPAMFADVWMQLTRAAERTTKIGLGPGVMVPSLRHPMTTAASIATLASIAGEDRVIVAVGSGFTGRMALGQRPNSWKWVGEYLTALQALLRGEETQWEGATIKMLHSEGWAPARPIDVPFLVAVSGPKGIEAARTYGQGVIWSGNAVQGFDWNVAIALGTVLEDGEDLNSERVLRAAGPVACLITHLAVEFGQPAPMPNGEAWVKAYAEVPKEVRHMAIHNGHAAFVSDMDRPFITPEILAKFGNAMDRSAWKDRLAEFEAGGVTEIIYQPIGDVARELDAFMNVAAS